MARISVFRLDINTIPTGIDKISGSSCPARLVAIMYDQIKRTGGEMSKIVASEREYQLVSKQNSNTIPTAFIMWSRSNYLMEVKMFTRTRSEKSKLADSK